MINYHKIKELRIDLSLSQEKLARLADVSKDYIGKIERGEVENPSLKVMARIAEALRVGLVELIA